MLRAFLVVASAALMLAPAAGATIVPQRGIAGVTVGMTPGKVRAVLGKPSSVKYGSNDFGSDTIFRYRGLQVEFQGNTKVTAVSTTWKTELTRSGVGVGSSEAQLKKGVKGLTCKTESGTRH